MITLELSDVVFKVCLETLSFQQMMSGILHEYFAQIKLLCKVIVLSFVFVDNGYEGTQESLQ